MASVGQWSRLNNATPWLHLHYRGFITTMGCSAPALRFGTLALSVGAACGFFLGIGEQAFSRSVQEPNWASRRLHAGCRSGGTMTSPELIPEVGSTPGFGIA